ncbi:MAG: tRNA uridine-5-carboxymethylaminomethyl(34) synthesis enzyme MnmG [Candidatus Aegiribacteria sp.]|nr:tRNA uridine-5-carboxymethylaminomethyl(34) synthesis enzyme MnmG [Candidatus Aegiribacteria sp.]
MNISDNTFDVIVVGGGHAGIEAVLAAERMGCSVMLITAKYSRIGEMSCNPAIGGIAKGTLVREIDSLDGSMGKAADATRLHFRMLNRRKGPAVWGPRVQSDADAYAQFQRQNLAERGIGIIEDEVLALEGHTEKLEGIRCRKNGVIYGRTVVLAVGTFLRGRLFRGQNEWRGGRIGDIAADNLEEDIRRRLFHVERFKTGTPARIVRTSVDTRDLIVQESEETDFSFSMDRSVLPIKHEKCYLTKTNRNTMMAAKEYMHLSPLLAGRIEGTGPRYCPSYEDKVVKFPEREQHNIYVEPMGQRSRMFYLNGLSSSLPAEAQEKMIRTLPGFKNAVIAVYGYAVEYSFIHYTEITPALRLRRTENVFVAGQMCGTSGYEEAAAQGLIAGANAARAVKKVQQHTPSRSNSYLGVMIDDIVSKGTDEPYRLFSSRAENRLYIRQDNAGRRLYEFGRSLGVLSERKSLLLEAEMNEAAEIEKLLKKSIIDGCRAELWCKRPGAEAERLVELIPMLSSFRKDIIFSVMLDEKYSGYIKRSMKRDESRRRASSVNLSNITSYMEIKEICWEAREVLEKAKPRTLADAEKIPGIRPTDLEGLLLYLAGKRFTWNNSLNRKTK